jgi:exodeoxyribonuclease VII large subunit
MIAAYWQTLDHREYQLRQIMAQTLQMRGQALQNIKGRLHAVSPLATLERGYAVVTCDEKLLTSAQHIAIGKQIRVRLARGHLDCEVLSKMERLDLEEVL